VILVRENFRYANGQIAAGQPIEVRLRGSATKPPLFVDPDGLVPKTNPVLTDSVGNLSFYIAPGSYDFAVFGITVPFDVEDGALAPSYVHVQTIPNQTWTIIHNLGFNPNVSVVIGGEEVLTDVSWPDVNTVIVGLDAPYLGSAYLS
jgi:hypothetical protein